MARELGRIAPIRIDQLSNITDLQQSEYPDTCSCHDGVAAMMV